MTVTISNGGTMFDGPQSVALFRLITMVSGLQMECKGMRLTRKAPTCYSIAKREFGLKGSKETVLAALEKILEERKAQETVIIQP